MSCPRIFAILLFLIGFACSPASQHEEQSSNAENNETQGPPNILFCLADDVSFPHMGAYGTSWINTPGFDRVAQEGILFTNCYTPNAKCAPSRSCILTGRNSWQLEEAANHWNYFPDKFKSVFEALSEKNYHVGYTGKGWAPGVTAEGRDLLVKKYSEHTTTPPTSQISDNDYAANFQAFLGDKPEDQPFCFWYGSTEPHRAYEYGSGVAKAKKSPSDIADEDIPDYYPANDSIRNDLLDYAMELEYFDQHLLKMLDILEEAGELENTLIVVTADNGMPFPRVKGNAYHHSNHLPLAIMWPAKLKSPGRTEESFVNFIDFAPTFLEVAGAYSADDVEMSPITGHSLTPILYDTEEDVNRPPRNHALIGKERHDIGRPGDVGYPIRGLVTAEFLYLRNFEPDRWPAGNPETGYLNVDGGATKSWILQDRRTQGKSKFWELNFGKRPAEELYDLKKDPDCIKNLADDENYADTKALLSAQLKEELTEQEDPRLLGKGDTFDKYRYMDEKHHNFYERYTFGEELHAGWVNEDDFETKKIEQ